MHVPAIVRFISYYVTRVVFLFLSIFSVDTAREVEQQSNGDGGRADYSKVPLGIMTSLNLIVFSDNNEYFLAERKFPALFD